MDSLLLIDIPLPDMPIERVLREIRTYWKLMRDVVDLPTPRVLVITAAKDRLDTGRLRRQGVLGRINKPINLKGLGLLVGRVLSGEVSIGEERMTRIGILDPEARSRDFFKSILRADDVEIVPLENEFELTAALTKGALDILLVELMGLPGSAVEFVASFRARNPGISLVAFSTAVLEDEERGRLDDLGVRAVFTKPVNPVALRQAVREEVVRANENAT
jgi:CheY-like chemotaxis protein